MYMGLEKERTYLKYHCASIEEHVAAGKHEE
jgi:hypothetical protein